MTRSDTQSDTQSSRRGGRPRRDEMEGRLFALLDTAAEIFAHQGYAGASIDSIASAARIGKPTIYARYGNKAGLLKAVIQHVLQHRLVPIDRPIIAQTAQGALQEQLANIIAASIAPAFIDLYRLYLNEGSRFPAIFEAFSPQDHTHRLLVEQLERNTAFDTLRVSKDEAASTMLAMAGMLVTMASAQPDYRETIDPSAEAARIVDVCLYGLLKRD
ncbi:putative TetR family transcriptional regulator [Caenibius tardaugens NBRC 16725]|uniref:Putative TetR family transcriptional regulator n=1 Tax=Caenibius tardaugens NBRC 16725 TaxID=1219035 RepID=U2YPW6_9SPHN|nr:TetR/AcrR family transcriptional regulator [Caenibius tardaugens]AZI35733.1 TetR/AcrR family transcriptional regulator [Caenibius tardaugens NBRC 16725]GAD50712.1 putative TetR family transcriptional regulator [Caenibius tardaugens NBRC 16725]